MGSLIFFFPFFSPAHQLALPVSHFELQGSLSGYDHQYHRIRAARVIFQKQELDHVMPPVQSCNGSPLSIGSHPNTIAWCSSATYFSELSFILPSFNMSVQVVTGPFNIPSGPTESVMRVMMFPSSFSISPPIYENITHP